MNRIQGFLVVVTVLLSVAGNAIELKKNETVAIVGSGFAEQMAGTGWLETAIQLHHKNKNIQLSHAGMSGYEVSNSMDGMKEKNLQGTLDDNIVLEADVVIAFFGMNESFAGLPQLDSYKQQLKSRLQTISQTINESKRSSEGVATDENERAPRVILVSPIAHETLAPPFSSGRHHNTVLERYVAAMNEVAAELGVVFVDLFYPSRAYYQRRLDRPLTSNGIQPTEYGYWYLAYQLALQLDWLEPEGQAPSLEQLESLRLAIIDKNREMKNKGANDRKDSDGPNWAMFQQTIWDKASVMKPGWQLIVPPPVNSSVLAEPL
ncbi:MAG: SGNH/GDSL hydrolase family protein [Pseudomonadales bacterium]